MKCKLGEHIELLSLTNANLSFGLDDVRGVNNLKQLMPTKAVLLDRDLSKFQVVNPGEFVFNHRTSRNGSKFSIAVNDTDKTVICTEDYVVFRIKEESKACLLNEWLYMFFNRSEFDRYVITNSWGSSTEFYNWEDLCDVDIELPDVEVQRKFVALYKSMVENQKSYERGLEDLKLVCDAFIEKLRMLYDSQQIGDYIELVEEKNNDGRYGLDDVRGISIEKQLIETKANMQDVNLTPYSVIGANQFAYVTVTSRNGEKISLALNDTDRSYICSSSYVVFKSKNEEELLPQYLMLFFARSEFDRYARFNSFGSARETFDWSAMCEVKIPIPDISVQRSIAELFAVYNNRKKINTSLKDAIRNICPVLIRGSLQYGG